MPDISPIPKRGRPTRLSSETAGNATVVVGLELLKTMSKAGRLMALTEVARETGMSASRTHRFLSSLQHADFVRKDERTGRYEIGPATIEIGIAALKRLDDLRIAGDVMRDLTVKTGLCSYMCSWGPNGPAVVRSEMGEVQTAVRMRIGSNLSMLTATGQIFLAYLPEEDTREFVMRDIEAWKLESPQRAASLESPARIRARVLRRGIARTRGMRNPTWTAFSCAVLDPFGGFRSALTVIGISSLFDIRIDGSIANCLKLAAQQLSGR